jgi:hypothetical protein
MALTPDEARQLLSQMDGGSDRPSGEMTPDIARQLLSSMDGGQTTPPPSLGGQMPGLSGPAAGEGGSPSEIQKILGTMMQAGAGMSGAKKGLMDFLSGAGQLGSRGLEAITGGAVSPQVPEYQPSKTEQMLMGGFPKTAAVGEFAGSALPLAALPEAAAGKMASLEPYLAQLSKGAASAGRLGGRLAKGAGVGAGVAPIYQPKQDLASSMEEGALGGAAGAALGPMLGAAGRGVGKAFSMGGTATEAEVKDAMEAAKRLGIKIPLAETIKSPVMKQGQSSFLTALPFSGMSKEYIKAGEGLNEQIDGLLKGIAPKTDQSVGKTLQEALIGAKSSAESEKNKLYSKVNDIASGMDQKVSPESYRGKAAQHLNEITKYAEDNEEFKDIFDPSVYSILNKATKKGDLSYEAAFDLDKRINNALQKSDAAQDYPTSSILRSLKGSINEDIDRSASTSGNEELTNAWQEAKNHFQSEVAPLRERDINKLTKREADLDTIIPNFLKTGAYERPQLLSRLTKHLSDEEKGNVGHQFLTKSLRQEGDDLKLNSDKVLNAYNKLGNKQRDLLFSKQDKRKLDDALKLRKLMGMDLSQMISPKTGEKVAKSIGLTSPVGAYALGGPAAAAGLLAGGRAAKEAVMSDALKSLYLKALQQSQMQSPELGRAALTGIPLLGNNRNK